MRSHLVLSGSNGDTETAASCSCFLSCSSIEVHDSKYDSNMRFRVLLSGCALHIVQESMSASMLRRIRAACLSRTTLALNLFEHVVNTDSSECLATPRLDAALMEFQYDVVMP